MRKLKLLTVISVFFFTSCNNSTTGIEGNNNKDNNVIIGDDNTVTIKKEDKKLLDHLSITLSVNNDLIDKMIKKAKDEDFADFIDTYDKIKYKISEDSNYIYINPVSEYYDNFYNNGTIKWVGNGLDSKHFWAPPPNIDFKVLNNSDETAYFNKVELKVQNSSIDRKPFFALQYDLLSLANIVLYQENWIPPKNIKFNYSIYTNKEESAISNLYKYSKSINISSLDDIKISFEDDLISEGVNVANLKKMAYDLDGKVYLQKEQIEAPLSYVKSALGRYKSCINKDGVNAYLKGVLEYEYLDQNGKVVSNKVNIGQEIELINGWGYGDMGVVTFEYKSMLKTEGENYNEQIDISQVIRPKEYDRFTLALGAEKSSHHIFTINLFNNGDLIFTSKPIILNLLRPRFSKE